MTSQLVALILESPRRAHLVGHGASGLEVDPVDIDTIECFGEAAVERMESIGWVSKTPITLGLPSAWCLCATIQREGLMRRGQEQAMKYRLEESLPIDAENLTATFVPIDRGRSLGIAVETECVQRVVDSLDRHGIDTGPIAPAAILCVETLLTSSDMDTSSSGTFIEINWPSGSADSFRLVDGRVMGWRHAFKDDASPEESPRVESVSTEDLDHSEASPVDDLVRHHVSGQEVLDAAAEAAANSAKQTYANHGDLRRGSLARSSRLAELRPAFLSFACSAVVLLTSVIAMNFLAMSRSQADVDASGRETQRLYGQTFPGSPIPLAVVARLRSEHAALEGQRGDVKIPVAMESATFLAELLVALPRDMRYQLEEIRVDDRGVVINGSARSHADAAELGRLLSASTPVAFEPPYTENLPERGVGFTLSGVAATSELLSFEKREVSP